MKKKILLAVASLACLASCGGTKSKDLTPVDDTTGIATAKKILEKEEAVLEAAETDSTKIFDLIPKNFVLENKTIMNGRMREIIKEGYNPEAYRIGEEISFNNLQTEYSRLDFDYNKAYFHLFEQGVSGDDFSSQLTTETYYYYDATAHKFYCLAEIAGIKFKIGEPTDISTIEDAQALLMSMLDPGPGSYGSQIILSFMPYLYLEDLTMEEPENANYTVLKTYKELSEVLSNRKDSKQSFSWQFGSDGEGTLSVRNNLKHFCSYQDPDLLYRLEGYYEGANTFNSDYDEKVHDFYLPTITYGIGTTGTSFNVHPDLVVFKDNIVSSIESTEVIDAESIESLGFAKGAAYRKYTSKNTFDVTKDAATITIPNPEEYNIPFPFL